MRTEFVELQVPTANFLVPENIEALLQAWGTPLRWAITKVANGHYQIEAIVTING